jgi:hypothetical protein
MSKSNVFHAMTTCDVSQLAFSILTNIMYLMLEFWKYWSCGSRIDLAREGFASRFAPKHRENPKHGIPWTAKISLNPNNGNWETMPLPKQFPNECISRARELMETYEHVTLLQPLMRLHRDPYKAARRRGEMHGTRLAVIASHNKKVWEWKDVCE